MDVFLNAAPSEELLKIPSLRILMFLSFFSTSQRGADWYKLQQQFPTVMRAVVWEKSGKSASFFIFLPWGKDGLNSIEGVPGKDISSSRSCYVSVYHFQAPRYGCQWCLCSSTSIREVKLAELGWGGKKREGNLCTLLPVAPRGFAPFALGLSELQGSGQRGSWSEAENSPQT